MRPVILLISAAACLCGCSPERKYVGVYSGKIELPPEVKKQMEEAQVQSIFDSSESKLTLNRDGTVRIIESAEIPGAGTQFFEKTGTWRAEPDKLVLDLKGPRGRGIIRPKQETVYLEFTDGGKTLTLNKWGFGKEPVRVVYRRSYKTETAE